MHDLSTIAASCREDEAPEERTSDSDPTLPLNAANSSRASPSRA